MYNHAKYFWNVIRHRVALRGIIDSGNISLLASYPPGHYYSPFPDKAEIDAHVCSEEVLGVDLNVPTQLSMLRKIAPLAHSCGLPVTKTKGFRYYLDNPFFSFADGLVLAGMLLHFKPVKVVEIGSGFSSAAMLDVNDRVLNGRTNFKFIDPDTSRLQTLLQGQNSERATIIQEKIQRLPNSIITDLEANDIFFIDSSHVAKLGSDVSHLLFNVLPMLRAGVIVHIHDIFWPFAYPKPWLESGRVWNECYILRAFLQFNRKFELIHFNSYITERHGSEVHRLCPDMLRTSSFSDTFSSSSLWLRVME